MPQVILQSSLRAEATSLNTQTDLMSQRHILDIQAIQLYQDRIQKKDSIRQWYIPLRRAKKDHLGTSEPAGGWLRELKTLEEMLQSKDMKSFYEKVNKLIKIKVSNPVVRALRLEDDQIIRSPTEIGKEIVKHYIRQGSVLIEDTGQLTSNREMKYTNNHPELFDTQDILDAIENTNFNKGVGPDGFDGRCLLTNDQLKKKVALDLSSSLNDGKLPLYLNVGR